jgi:hypothetical protein
MTVKRINAAPRRPITLARRIVRDLWAVFLLAIIVPNATRGDFDYPDTDECACLVTYTTHPSRASCTQLRGQHCDFQLNHLLLFLSFLDFNR